MTDSDSDPKGAPPASAPLRFTRRELLRVGATTAAAAATVGAGLALLDRDPGVSRHDVVAIRDHRVALPTGGAQMAIARGFSPAENVKRAVEALGGMGAFIRPGDKVAIKPNVGWNRLPEQAACTNPELVAAVVRMAVAAGASKVWVTDAPVNDAVTCFQRSGIRAAAGEAGATLVLPTSNNLREVAMGGEILRVGDVLYPIVEADKIINLPIAKHHGLTGVTLSMKNWYGLLGGHRVRLHQDIEKCIVELAKMAKPTLTILDATRVLLANGPSGGSLDDVKQLDTVAACTDEVALDAFGATLLGRNPAEIGFIAAAEKAGLGRSDFRSLKLVEVSA
jgi:uncharacterized protein (DUF362 family)